MYRHENDAIVSEDVVNEYEVGDAPEDNGVTERHEQTLMTVNKPSDTSIISVLSEMSESNEEVIKHNEAFCIINEEVQVQIHTIEDKTVNPEEAIDTIKDDNEDENIQTASIEFLQPSEVDILSKGKIFKCDKCEYATTRRSTFNNHKVSNHNWCHICFSSFQSQDNLVTHMKITHSDIKRLTGTGKGP